MNLAIPGQNDTCHIGMLGNFAIMSFADFFFSKFIFQKKKKSFANIIQLGPCDQAGQNAGPDLGLNFFKRLYADG